MLAVPIKEAVERLIKATEEAGPDDLVEIYRELFPARPRPDASGPKAALLAQEIITRMRTRFGPDEVVDLWNVIFPLDMYVYFDEEDEVLRQRERRLRYAKE